MSTRVACVCMCGFFLLGVALSPLSLLAQEQGGGRSDEAKTQARLEDYLAAFEDASWEVRNHALVAIGKMGTTLSQVERVQAVPKIRELLKDKVECVRIHAIVMLGRLQANEAIADIRGLLSDGDGDIRGHAVAALGHLRAKEALLEIKEMLKDKEQWVRGLTGIALVEIGANDSVPRESVKDIQFVLSCIKSDKVWSQRAATALRALSLPENDIRESQERTCRYIKFILPSTAMQPTICEGSIVTVDMEVYATSSPQRWDIVVFDPPSFPEKKYRFTMRVVGLPGETVGFSDDGNILIDGKKIEKPEELSDIHFALSASSGAHPFTVPADSYYVLGDSPKTANDSRSWGALPRGNILGKVIAK